MCDYGRVGRDGKKRDLHIEKALAVTNRMPMIREKKSYPHVADCDYFTVDRLNLDGNVMKKLDGNVSADFRESFQRLRRRRLGLRPGCLKQPDLYERFKAVMSGCACQK